MMRRSKRDYAPSAIEQAAQRNWNEAWSFHREQARRWSIFGTVALVVAGLAVARTWYYDGQPKMIPYVVDRNGPSVMTAQLVAKMPDAARIEGHLREWVAGMRTVSSDVYMQQHLIAQTYAWVDDTSIAHQQLDAWYKANNPFERGKANSIDVDVTSVIPQGGESWLVDWTETILAREPGKMQQLSYWRMTVIVHIRLPETDAEFKSDWDGVYTQSFHITALPGRPS